ncbi:MAG: hypothetical protein PHE61_03830 [Candidatus Omnitrophica bacterium]|nr:hypothetical protein [Candidatus Omnitrophota bacterium]
MVISDSLRKEIEKYKREMEDIPWPNQGRIQELRDAIRKGTLINKKVLRETAQNLLNHLTDKCRT